jgi:uncharacterized protein
MKIAVTGASGLVGSGLVKLLQIEGHEVFAMVRRPAQSPNELSWDPATGGVDTGRLSKMDAVIHLAGEGIADKRWTPEQKRKIRESRVDATYKLATAIAACSPRPSVFITASAVGFYGNRGEEILTEEDPIGTGFLAELCHDWENATLPAAASEVRVAHARIGMVLSTRGGALAKLLPIFKLGAGGPLGNGQQYMSWIDELDLTRAISFLLKNDVKGPVNMTSPNPVTNKEFTRVLGKVLRRPAFLPVPPFALQAAMGEVANELLFSSQKVMPAVLQKAGFEFKYPDLEQSLRHVVMLGSVANQTAAAG